MATKSKPVPMISILPYSTKILDISTSDLGEAMGLPAEKQMSSVSRIEKDGWGFGKRAVYQYVDIPLDKVCNPCKAMTRIRLSGTCNSTSKTHQTFNNHTSSTLPNCRSGQLLKGVLLTFLEKIYQLLTGNVLLNRNPCMTWGDTLNPSLGTLNPQLSEALNHLPVRNACLGTIAATT